MTAASRRDELWDRVLATAYAGEACSKIDVPLKIKIMVKVRLQQVTCPTAILAGWARSECSGRRSRGTA